MLGWPFPSQYVLVLLSFALAATKDCVLEEAVMALPIAMLLPGTGVAVAVAVGVGATVAVAVAVAVAVGVGVGTAVGVGVAVGEVPLVP
ncbi:hypothetical protein D3C85_1694540 [compost metagenome]